MAKRTDAKPVAEAKPATVSKPAAEAKPAIDGSSAKLPAVRKDMSPVLAGEFGAFAVVRADAGALAAVRENIGDGQLTRFDLDSVKMPAGGGIAWEIPGEASDGGPDVCKEFAALIIHAADQRAYWKKSIDESGGGSPPDCQSSNAREGHGNPGGECALCPFSKFGSAKPKPGQDEAKGQACRQIKLLFLMRPVGILPIALALPPTSLKPAKMYLLRLGSRGLPYYGTLTKFSLAKTSSGGNDYSVAQLTQGEVLSDEQLAFVRGLRAEMLRTIQTEPIRYEDFLAGGDVPSVEAELPAM